jgi:hypothetical protein
MNTKIRLVMTFAVLLSLAATGMAFHATPTVNAHPAAPGQSMNESTEAQLDSGLVGFYPFNGNANDASGLGNHGEVFGAALADDRFGTPNSAYSFDGVNDHIDMGYIPELNFGTGDFAISCWFLVREFGDNPLVSRWQAGSWAWDLRIGWPSGAAEADKLFFGFGSSPSELIKMASYCGDKKSRGLVWIFGCC